MEVDQVNIENARTKARGRLVKFNNSATGGVLWTRKLRKLHRPFAQPCWSEDPHPRTH